MGIFDEPDKNANKAPSSLPAAVKYHIDNSRANEGSKVEVVKKDPMLKDWIKTARSTINEWKQQSCELLNSPELK